jgi:hypothetical protein
MLSDRSAEQSLKQTVQLLPENLNDLIEPLANLFSVPRVELSKKTR